MIFNLVDSPLSMVDSLPSLEIAPPKPSSVRRACLVLLHHSPSFHHIRHSREGGSPLFGPEKSQCQPHEIPACAGMTNKGGNDEVKGQEKRKKEKKYLVLKKEGGSSYLPLYPAVQLIFHNVDKIAPGPVFEAYKTDIAYRRSLNRHQRFFACRPRRQVFGCIILRGPS